MHTAFCDKSHSQEVFDNMKNDLQAIIAFLESKDFEDAVRNAVSLGGDTDTLGAITGSIAERMFQSRFTQTRRQKSVHLKMASGFVQPENLQKMTEEKQDSLCSAYPSLQNMYSADDGNTEVFYFKNATATFSSFTHEPEVVKF